MREILFRGKTEKGEWVYGYYEFYNDGHYINVQTDRVNSGGYLIREFIEVIPETVGKYTGLLDKDGNKVFEGDIVKVYDNFDYVGEVLYVGKVQWNDTFLNWELKTSEKTVWQLKNLPSVLYYEVIGNVFDNPKLLEVK